MVKYLKCFVCVTGTTFENAGVGSAKRLYQKAYFLCTRDISYKYWTPFILLIHLAVLQLGNAATLQAWLELKFKAWWRGRFLTFK